MKFYYPEQNMVMIYKDTLYAETQGVTGALDFIYFNIQMNLKKYL